MRTPHFAPNPQSRELVKVLSGTAKGLEHLAALGINPIESHVRNEVAETIAQPQAGNQENEAGR